MARVEYSSDEDTFDRRVVLRGDDSDSSDSSPKLKGRVRKATRKAKAQAKAVEKDTESFVEMHKSQIAIAAAVAGGLAVASFVVSKMRGNKRKEAEKGKGASTSLTSEPTQPAVVQTKKLAARRKRSGYATAMLASTSSIRANRLFRFLSSVLLRHDQT